MKNYSLIYVTILLSGCFSNIIVKPAEMESQKSSMLGIRISGPFMNIKPCEVYFIKMINENGHSLGCDKVIKSNFITDYGAFILNAPPGEYVVLGAKYILKSMDTERSEEEAFITTLFFPEEMVLLSKSTVEAGEMIFLGEYNVNRYYLDKNKPYNKLNIEELKGYFKEDPAKPPPIFYANIPFCINSVILELAGNESYSLAVLNRFNKNKENEMYFYIANRDEFIGTQWYDLIVYKIKSLKGTSEKPVKFKY